MGDADNDVVNANAAASAKQPAGLQGRGETGRMGMGELERGGGSAIGYIAYVPHCAAGVITFLTSHEC